MRVVLSHMVVKQALEDGEQLHSLRVVLSHMVVKLSRSASLAQYSLRVVLSHMVVKQPSIAITEEILFESSVISYGSQALSR